MRQLYYSLLALIVWLSLLFHLEGLVVSFRLTPFLYVFIPACAVAIIVALRYRKVAMSWLLIGGVSAYAVLEYLFGSVRSGENLPVLITSFSAVIVTILLSGFVGRRLAEVRTAIVSLVVGQAGSGEVSFWDAQGLLYREVRRARRHHHSLVLLALALPKLPASVTIEPAPNAPMTPRVIQDMQRELVNKYVLARAARLLQQHLADTAIITLRDDHYVVLLPETSGEEVPAILNTLQDAAHEQMGLAFRIGVATFPDQAITFEGLLEQAEAAMVNRPVVHTAPAVQPPAAHAAPAVFAVPAAYAAPAAAQAPLAAEGNGFHRERGASDGANLTATG